MAPAIASATSCGPPDRRGRHAGLSEHLEVVAEDHRLDLRAAEIDAAEQAHVRTIAPSHVSHSAGSKPP